MEEGARNRRRGEGVLVGWRREQGIGGGVKECW